MTTLWLLVFYGLGNIIDAGIYILSGEIAKEAGYCIPICVGFDRGAFYYPLSAAEALYVKEEELGDALFCPKSQGRF